MKLLDIKIMKNKREKLLWLEIVFVIIIVLCGSLFVGCKVNSPVTVVSKQSIGKVDSMYCHDGNMELKTDTGFIAVAIGKYFTCPVVQLRTEAFVTRYSNGDCQITWNDNNYKCH